jgi:hypothetical protein
MEPTLPLRMSRSMLRTVFAVRAGAELLARQLVQLAGLFFQRHLAQQRLDPLRDLGSAAGAGSRRRRQRRGHARLRNSTFLHVPSAASAGKFRITFSY